MKKKFHVKDYYNILDIIVCLILGFVFSCSPEYYETGSCKITLFIVGRAFLEFILFLIATIIVRYGITKINYKKRDNNNRFFQIFDSKNKYYKYRLFIIAGIIFLAWVPILIILYPGTLANDTWGQLRQYLSLFQGGNLSDHHPVCDTLTIGFIIIEFLKLFKRWHLAFFAYVIIQSIITSLVFSKTIVFAKEKLKVKNVYIFIMILIYALFPIFPGIVQGISKDSLFAWIYVLFFIDYLEIVRTNGESINKTKNWIYIGIISLACCLTKKVGFYIILLSLVGLLFYKIVNRKKIIGIVIFLVLVSKIIMPYMFEKYNVTPGGEQEKYSMLFQQTGRYLKDNGNDVTKEEKEIIEEVIGKSTEKIVSVYNPVFADPIKGYHQPTKTENYKKYLIVWIKQGLRHPKSYLNATNSMISGWISFRMYKPLLNMNHHDQLNAKYFKEELAYRNRNKKIADWLQNAYDWFYKIPIVKYFFTYGMYAVLIPLFCFTTLIKNKKYRKYVIALLPLFLSIVLGCFLSPTSGAIEGQRYLYPIIYTSQLVMMWTISYVKK